MTPSSYYPEQPKGITQPEAYGLIHVCFGTGAGKTSRCVGLAIRAAGAGLKVTWVQFMKSDDSSEAGILRSTPGVDYLCPGKHPFILPDGAKGIHFEHAASALAMARQAVERGTTVLICDEILNTTLFGVLTQAQLLDLMELCRGRVELVMSGAAADQEIMDKADYVTEFVLRKHPYYSGHPARKGIEF